METIRKEKAEMYNKLKNQRNTPEFDKYFLRYIPNTKIISTDLQTKKKKSTKKKTKKTKK